jgi:hypothetical protein
MYVGVGPFGGHDGLDGRLEIIKPLRRKSFEHECKTICSLGTTITFITMSSMRLWR